MHLCLILPVQSADLQSVDTNYLRSSSGMCEPEQQSARDKERARRCSGFRMYAASVFHGGKRRTFSVFCHDGDHRVRAVRKDFSINRRRYLPVSPFPFIRIIRGAVQPKNTQNLDWHGLTTKDAVIRGDEQNRHLVLPFCKPIAFLFCLSIITLWDFKSHIETEVLI